MPTADNAKAVLQWLDFFMGRLKAVNSPPVEVSALLKKTMCEFQLEYTEFQFTASQLHKRFKEADKRGDREKAGELYQGLTDFVESGIKLSCQSIGGLLQEYFCKSRVAHDRPRVGIHAVDKDRKISPMFITDNSAEYQSKSMDDFTPFKEIIKTGTPYLQNNIPRIVCNQINYIHAGLNLERIRKKYRYGIWPLNKAGVRHAIMNSMPISRWNRSGKSHRDTDWNSVAPAGESSDTTVYKSHLIVPITFRGHGNKIPRELVKVLKLREDGRSILGFVAIDHPTTHYFDSNTESDSRNIDVNVVFIIADMLSLVRITEFMYTTGSTSYCAFKVQETEGE